MKLGTKLFIVCLTMIFTFTAFAAGGNTRGGKIRETNQNALNLDDDNAANAANSEEEALLKEEIPTQKNEATTEEASEEAKLDDENLSDEEVALANSYPEGLESAEVNF